MLLIDVWYKHKEYTSYKINYSCIGWDFQLINALFNFILFRFLGHFQPQQDKPALWELDSDQHYHVGRHGPCLVDENVRYRVLMHTCFLYLIEHPSGGNKYSIKIKTQPLWDESFVDEILIFSHLSSISALSCIFLYLLLVQVKYQIEWSSQVILWFKVYLYNCVASHLEIWTYEAINQVKGLVLVWGKTFNICFPHSLVSTQDRYAFSHPLKVAISNSDWLH